MVCFLREEEIEERFFLPLPESSLSSSNFALASLAAGTEPALLPPDLATSRSFWLMTTLGLALAGLSATMLSRSSMVSVSFLLPWRSRPDLLWPTLGARDADGGTSSAFRSADRRVMLLQMSLEPSESFSWAISSLVILMFSRSAASSSASIRDEASSPRSITVRKV
jgi:hypothetical protein